jgi:hypothetical protein
MEDKRDMISVRQGAELGHAVLEYRGGLNAEGARALASLAAQLPLELGFVIDRERRIERSRVWHGSR